MKKKLHYDHQLKYFGEEFGRSNSYKLASWQKSYINRIKESLLDNKYKGRRVIDIATGSGYVAIELAKMGLDVIAIDLTPEAVSNLKKYKKEFKLDNLVVQKSLAEKINIKDKSVDYLVANAILEHIPDEQKAVSEWKRITKKNGKIFITVPLKLRYVWPFLWIPNIFHDKKIGHLRRYDLQSLKKSFNLPVVKVYYSGHLVKVYGILFSKLFRFEKYDAYFEEKDRLLSDKAYGANNITVVFKNK